MWKKVKSLKEKERERERVRERKREIFDDPPRSILESKKHFLSFFPHQRVNSAHSSSVRARTHARERIRQSAWADHQRKSFFFFFGPGRNDQGQILRGRYGPQRGKKAVNKRKGLQIYLVKQNDFRGSLDNGLSLFFFLLWFHISSAILLVSNQILATGIEYSPKVAIN